MRRREFITRGVTGLTAVTLGPLIVSREGEVAASSAVSAVAAGHKTVAHWLSDFVLAAGIGTIFDSVLEWLSSLGSTERAEAERVNSLMASSGFIILDSPVYAHGNNFFYYAINQDGFNACAPFFVGNEESNPLIEGPALMGIAVSGLDWTNPDVSAADALIPNRQYQTNGSEFGVSLEYPLHYDTNAGTLDIGYTAYPNTREGTISVVASHSNGGLLYGADHDIMWV
jgi:hypothetical protein